MKVQELSALVGGFMKIIMFIAGIVITPYNDYLMKSSLINEFFESDIDKQSNIKELSIDCNYNNSQLEINNIKEKSINTGEMINHKINNFTNVDKKEEKIQQKPHRTVSLILDKALSKIKRKKFDLNYFQYLKSLVINSNDTDVKRFKTACNILDCQIDIASYMKTLRQFEVIKSLILTYEQDYSLNYIKKPNVNSKEDLKLVYLSLFQNNKKENQSNTKDIFNDMISFIIQRNIDKSSNDMNLKLIAKFEDPIRDYILER